MFDTQTQTHRQTHRHARRVSFMINYQLLDMTKTCNRMINGMMHTKWVSFTGKLCFINAALFYYIVSTLIFVTLRTALLVTRNDALLAAEMILRPVLKYSLCLY